MPSSTKEGIILINKPKGITSHDVVDIVRRRLGIRKVGHAGTLDPLAEGLMVILVGRFTKAFSQFVSFDKEYTGILKLGEVTSTGDSEGKLVKQGSWEGLDKKKLEAAFSRFVGEIEQVPPMVSALRLKGKRLYSLARRGITVERAARPITIYSLVIEKIDLPYIAFCTRCSKGTYIRKLAEDIGEELACGAHMVKIVRTGIGPFRLENALSPEEIDESHLQKITF